MVSTSYVDPVVDWDAYALQARTDSGGTAVTDLDGEDARLVMSMYSGGVVGQDDYRVREDSPAAMRVVVGSGAAAHDLAVLEGTASGQGNYAVRNADATTAVDIDASDASNPRIDEIYLVVRDNTYDSGGLTLPRLAYRKGDPASSPAAPGPDGAWDAYLLLAAVAVGASVSEITDGDIVDARVFASSLVDARPAPGVIEMFGGATAPTGALMCQGQAVSRSTYKRLFAAIGTVHGVGDGATTFNLPDLRQRFPIGRAASGTGSTLGAKGGSIDHSHSGPSHTHSGPGHNHSNPDTANAGAHAHSQGDTGPGIGGTALGTVGGGELVSVPGHNHSNPGVDSSGQHQHAHANTGSAGTGQTGASGTGQTGVQNPPWIALNFIIWT